MRERWTRLECSLDCKAAVGLRQRISWTTNFCVIVVRSTGRSISEWVSAQLMWSRDGSLDYCNAPLLVVKFVTRFLEPTLSRRSYTSRRVVVDRGRANDRPAVNCVPVGRSVGVVASSCSSCSSSSSSRCVCVECPADLSRQNHLRCRWDMLLLLSLIIVKEIYIAPFRHAPKALSKQKVKC